MSAKVKIDVQAFNNGVNEVLTLQPLTRAVRNLCYIVVHNNIRPSTPEKEVSIGEKRRNNSAERSDRQEWERR